MFFAVFFIAATLAIIPVLRQRRIQREMIANVTAQLEDDILAYGWLGAVAEYHHPRGNSSSHCELICGTIHRLIEQDAIVIGHAASGATIHPWQGTKSELIRRTDRTISELGPPDQANSFQFWIGLPSSAEPELPVEKHHEEAR